MEKSSVSIHFVSAALAGMQTRQMDTGPILVKAGIPAALLSRDKARVPVARYAALLREVAQVLDDEFFGLDSRRMKIGSFALSCLLALGQKDIGRALTMLCRSYNATLDDVQLSLLRDGNRAALDVRPTDGARPLSCFAVETLFVYIHGVACWLARRRIVVDEAAFRYPAPVHADEYAVLFGSTLRFQQPFCRFWFDAAILSLPVVQNERTAQSFLNQAPDSFLVKYRNPDGVGRRVTRLLQNTPIGKWPLFDEVAAELRCSPATLRRALRQEGLPYQTLKDRLRLDAARELLAANRLSLTEIAIALGFAEPSAFSRAFRLWTGQTPAHYRRQSSIG